MRALRAGRLALAGLALAGCNGPERAALPARPSVVSVAMRDYEFDHKSTVPSGRVLFRIRNVGRVPHSLRLLALPEEMPPILEQLRGAERRSIIPEAVIKAHRPGESTTFAVDLAAGSRYALVCFVTDDQGMPHALRGMASEFRSTK